MFKKRHHPAQPAVPVARTDWSQLESVRNEWPTSNFNPDGDLRAWQSGMAQYDAVSESDYLPLMAAAGNLCQALRYELHGDGILTGDDLPTTAWNVLFCALCPPPDRRTLTPDACKFLRLALTVLKKGGWQPVSFGGDGRTERIFSDQGNRMLLMAAIAPSANEFAGDLKNFFTTNPVVIDHPYLPLFGRARQPTASPPSDLLDEMDAVLREADAGDPASQARVAAFAAQSRGDLEGALVHHEKAAQLGDVAAMFDAGCLANKLGRGSQSSFWHEAAAREGHAQSMFNLAAQAVRDGDLATAKQWYSQAAAAGEVDGYAALTQIADEAGDDAAELHWSSLGAEAGQPFCQERFGQLQGSDNPQALRRGISFFEKASAQGQVNANFLAGLAYMQLNEPSNARLWLQRADKQGHPRASEAITAFGL